MKNRERLAIMVLVSALFVLCGIGFSVDRYNVVITTKNNFESVNFNFNYEKIMNFVYQISAVMNVYFIYLFYKLTNVNNEQKEKRQSKLQWFKEIILKQNIDVLDKFYYDIQVSREEFNEIDKLDKKFEVFSDRKHILVFKFISLLEILDRELYDKMYELIIHLEDEYTEMLAKRLETLILDCQDDTDISNDVTHSEIDVMISKSKKIFYEVLFNYELSQYVCTR